MYTRLACAVGLPLLSWAAALFVGLEPEQWLSLSAPVLRELVPDALLFTAGAAILGGPLAGVAARARILGDGRQPWRQALTVTSWLAVDVLVFVMASALLTLYARGGGADALAFVGPSHATLAAVALALGLFGAVCGALFRDPLDAAACSLTIALLAAGGLLVAGASVADMPRGLIDLALLASPLVAVGSAAHIDLVRMDLFYQISPLAHLGVGYPAWHVSSAWYLAMALVCFAGLVWTLRTSRSRVPGTQPLHTSQVS